MFVVKAVAADGVVSLTSYFVLVAVPLAQSPFLSLLVVVLKRHGAATVDAVIMVFSAVANGCC